MRFEIREEHVWSEWVTKFAILPVRIDDTIRILWETYEERNKFHYAWDSVRYRSWTRQRRLVDHKIDGHTPIPTPILQKPAPPPPNIRYTPTSREGSDG